MSWERERELSEKVGAACYFVGSVNAIAAMLEEEDSDVAFLTGMLKRRCEKVSQELDLDPPSWQEEGSE